VFAVEELFFGALLTVPQGSSSAVLLATKDGSEEIPQSSALAVVVLAGAARLEAPVAQALAFDPQSSDDLLEESAALFPPRLVVEEDVPHGSSAAVDVLPGAQVSSCIPQSSAAALELVVFGAFEAGFDRLDVDEAQALDAACQSSGSGPPAEREAVVFFPPLEPPQPESSAPIPQSEELAAGAGRPEKYQSF